MPAGEVLILGQGLAGTLLGWALEREGIAFQIIDPGHAEAASLVAAGMVNPVTGRRFVKSWRVDTLLPLAQETYAWIGESLGAPLWRELRIRRLFTGPEERRVFERKRAAGVLAPYVERSDEQGFWIERAGGVDVPALLERSRQRWRERRWLREGGATIAPTVDGVVVIDCRGVAAARAQAFGFVPWEFSKGEVLEIAVDGLEPGVVLNRGEWVLPTQPGVARVGATHESGVSDREPTTAGRARLEAAAHALLQRSFSVRSHQAGVRVTLRDRRPVAGRHPHDRALGIIGALGAKGVLFAPFLARQWVDHLVAGEPFDPDIDVARLAPGAA